MGLSGVASGFIVPLLKSVLSWFMRATSIAVAYLVHSSDDVSLHILARLIQFVDSDESTVTPLKPPSLRAA